MKPRRPLLVQLGVTVRSLRKARHWPRRELAAQTGLSERFLADIETGRANPSLLRLCDLAEALGTTVKSLLAAAEQHTPATRRGAVALLGLRGAGKSSVGNSLARRLSCPFFELDALVEQAAGLSLTEMFQMHGEAYYRRTEDTVLRQLLERGEPMVLATGGGLVTARATFEHLKARAHTVWLHARPEDHWTRVVAQGDTRPMADNEQAFVDLCSILSERERLYRQAEHLVDTSGRDADQVTEELALHFAFLSHPPDHPPPENGGDGEAVAKPS